MPEMVQVAAGAVAAPPVEAQRWRNAGASAPGAAAAGGQHDAGGPVIDWTAALAQPAAASAGAGRPGWLGDFVNGLGQTERERNPNAAIEIAAPWSPVAKAKTGLTDYAATVPSKRR